MALIETLYAAAARAGLLKDCTWQPSDGGAVQSRSVGFSAPDEALLDGLALSTDYEMSYPASAFQGLAAREVVEIDGEPYQVRDIRAVGDGSELRAKLTRI